MTTITKPTIELKKISHNARLSEETFAYSAQLWVDGKHFADVMNHGHGGSDMQHPVGKTTYDDIVALNARIKATFPKRPYDFGEGHKGEFEADIESVCTELVSEHLITKDLTRLLKRTVAFFVPSDGSVRSYKGKHEGAARAHLITETLRKNPNAQILNNLPFADALKIYRENTGA